MEEERRNLIYARDVLDFVTVSTEYCTLMDSLHTYTQEKFIQYTLKLLPLIYMKAQLLPDIELDDREGIEKYVSEEEWNKVNLQIHKIMDNLDQYTESAGRIDSNESSSVSENFADIYQDLRDFVYLYSTGVDEIMYDGVGEVNYSFKEYWGQRVVNLLRVLHYYCFNKKLKTELPSEVNETEDWVIEQRKKEWGMEE